MYFFIISANNSGTTAASQYLAAVADAYLPPFGNYEGQFIPEVRDEMRGGSRLWSREKQINFHRVKTVWDGYLERSGKKIFVEASPENMARVGDLFEAFPERKSVFMMSSPYMQIASGLKNYQNAPLTKEMIGQVARSWLRKARYQVENMDRWPDVPYLRYEDFCADPARLATAFDLQGTDISAIPGKSTTGVREVRDMSTKTRSFLTIYEAAQISGVLASETALLDRLGYRVETLEDIEGLYSRSAAQIHAGLLDRLRWEDRPPPSALRAWVGRRPALKKMAIKLGVRPS